MNDFSGGISSPTRVGPQRQDFQLRVVVDLNRCQGYAQCCYASPDHFTLHGHEILFYDPAPPSDKRAEVERAVHACPVRAISLQAVVDEPGPGS